MECLVRPGMHFMQPPGATNSLRWPAAHWHFPTWTPAVCTAYMALSQAVARSLRMCQGTGQDLVQDDLTLMTGHVCNNRHGTHGL